MTNPKTVPEPEGEESKIRQLIKWVGQFVGIVGGGGAGFAALSFGIGYLATKSHDAMLGLPTTTSTYESYVRIGSLFFSNSSHYLITTISDYIWTIAVPGMIIMLAVTLVLSRFPLTSLSKYAWIAFVIAYTVVNLLGFMSTKRLSAVLDPGNKGLLLVLPQEVKHGGYEKEIYDFLRDEDGELSLQRIYSKHLAQTIIFVCLAIALFQWRRKLENNQEIKTSQTSGQSDRRIFLFASDWFFRPIFCLLVFFHLVLLPTNYGVLCLSNKYPRVFVTLKKGKIEGVGFLLSDMSVDLKEVLWLFREDGGQLYTHHFLEKENIKALKIISIRGQRNILALGIPKQTSEGSKVTSK